MRNSVFMVLLAIAFSLTLITCGTVQQAGEEKKADSNQTAKTDSAAAQPEQKAQSGKKQMTQEEIEAFISSARNGEIEEVKKYYNNGGDVNAVTETGNTALMWAAQKGHIEVVKFLVTIGANVNAVDKYREEPVLMWATKKGNKEVVEFLIEKGADVNQGDRYKETPMMDASRYGHLDIVKMLFNKRAMVNSTSETGESALMWAAENGHKDIVEFLIKNGGDINKINYRTGETAMAKAKKKGAEDIVAMLSKQAQVEGDLLKRPIKPEDKGLVNEPPDEKELFKAWAGRESSLPEALNERQIMVHMNSFLPNITQCYQERLQNGDHNMMGTMQLEIRLAGSGKIVDIYFKTPKYQGSLFGDCIIDAIKAQPFPMFHDGVLIFQYSYTL